MRMRRRSTKVAPGVGAASQDQTDDDQNDQGDGDEQTANEEKAPIADRAMPRLGIPPEVPAER